MAGQHLGGLADDARHLTARVDHRIPRPPAGQAFKAGLLCTIAADHLDAGDVAAGPATVEGGDLTASSHRLLDQRTPEEPCPTQHQKPHAHRSSRIPNDGRQCSWRRSADRPSHGEPRRSSRWRSAIQTFSSDIGTTCSVEVLAGCRCLSLLRLLAIVVAQRREGQATRFGLPLRDREVRVRGAGSFMVSEMSRGKNSSTVQSSSTRSRFSGPGSLLR